jgi:chromosome segregation protein
MLLTKLEIKGFKSFADKVVINFDKGITGIVGPNGCGKSNIIDAIRWVLGEQKTKNLRSDKMENVIFNGTKDRKPTQLAEVSLTFDNHKAVLPTEYSQVTITRKLFRTGDSEYLLNGVTCRLKDIHNLFLDTGIGSDSYAIIELKMIDEILNDHNNSRRGLFEEAAGISKFKVRKKETLKKLEDTDADLARVEDLLFEIAKNMKNLERQAKQAEKYYQIKEIYKQQSIELGKKVVSIQNEKVQRLQAQLHTETQQRQALQKQIEEKENSIESIKKVVLDKEKLYTSRQKTLQEHTNRIRQYESDKKLRAEQLKYLAEKQKNLENQLFADKKQTATYQEQLQSLQAEKIAAEQLLAAMAMQVEALKTATEESKTQSANLQQSVQQYSSLFRKKQDELFALRKNLEISQVQYNSLRQELEKNASLEGQQRADLAEFEDKIIELKEELAAEEQLLKDMTAAEESRQQQIIEKQQSIEQQKDDLAKVNRRIDALQNEYNLTKSLIDNLEGFPEAIKFLKKQGGELKNAPLLSDILTCEPQYRVAIENFLEPYMNYYVVDNEATALQAISLLDSSGKGKASFFILDRIPNKNAQTLPTELPNNLAATVAALQIIEFDEKYKSLFELLLANVLITDDDSTSPLAGLEEFYTFISKNGKIIKRPYSLSGGSVGLFEGKRIGRAKNLEKLHEEIQQLKAEWQAKDLVLKQDNQLLQNLRTNTQKDELQRKQRQIAALQQQIIAVYTKQEQYAEMLRNNALRKEDIEEKLAELKQEILDNEPLVKQLTEELKTIEAQVNSTQQALAESNEVQNQKSSAFNQQNLLYYQQKNRVENLGKDIAQKESSIMAGEKRIAQNQVDLEGVSKEIEKLSIHSEVAEDELENLYAEKIAIEKGVTEAETDYYASRESIAEVEKQIREAQRSKDHLDTLLMNLQSGLNESKLQLVTVKDRLSVEFQIDLDELMQGEVTLSPLSEEELRATLKQTKEQLEKIGSINPMAMEAYNEIKERHDFIITQKDDLLKAKNSLLNTISEIDTVAQSTFLEAFHKIREYFQNVFRTLFTEDDTCDLVLVEPNDPLESKIDIIAKPKGKRPLTINQLSGGEKTLTATALLFAFYLLRPAPFCIFDEVDAPLDDANIDKFNNIIRKFSDNSQFIIVTHNKRTMASTDIMYGVTMIEQGVSRVVAVDLREMA